MQVKTSRIQEIQMYPQHPQPAPRKSRTGCLIAAAVVTIVGLAGFGGCAALVANTPDPGSVSAPVPSDTGYHGSTPSETPSSAKPRKGDFDLHVKTLSKECFGEAGCNITFRIKPEYTGPPLDPDATYEVTYKMSGTQDPMTNTFTITGTQASVEQEEIAQTTSSAIELHAHATSVEKL